MTLTVPLRFKVGQMNDYLSNEGKTYFLRGEGDKILRRIFGKVPLIHE